MIGTLAGGLIGTGVGASVGAKHDHPAFGAIGGLLLGEIVGFGVDLAIGAMLAPKDMARRNAWAAYFADMRDEAAAAGYETEAAMFEQNRIAAQNGGTVPLGWPPKATPKGWIP